MTSAQSDRIFERIKRNRTALVGAALRGGIDVNARDPNGWTPLHLACAWNSAKVAAYLIRRGARVNERDACGSTPLHLAASRHALETAVVLVKAGAVIDARDRDGDTPLLLATGYGPASTALFLLRRGANVRARNRRGHTALHDAAEADQVPLAGLLLQRGANPLARDRDGLTPLHYAASSGASNSVALLLNRGCHVNDRTRDGSTPLLLALDPTRRREVREHNRRPAAVDFATSTLPQRRRVVELLKARGAAETEETRRLAALMAAQPDPPPPPVRPPQPPERLPLDAWAYPGSSPGPQALSQQQEGDAFLSVSHAETRDRPARVWEYYWKRVVPPGVTFEGWPGSEQKWGGEKANSYGVHIAPDGSSRGVCVQWPVGAPDVGTILFTRGEETVGITIISPQHRRTTRILLSMSRRAKEELLPDEPESRRVPDR